MSSPISARPGTAASFARVRMTAASVSCRIASPWTAIWRRDASSDASRSEDGEVVRSSRIARPTAPMSMRSPSTTCSIALCVSDPMILCVDVSTASAPSASAPGGRSGWKPKCGPHAWSTTSGTPAAWRPRRSRRRRRPCRSTSARRGTTAPASGSPPAPRASDSGVTPLAMPSSTSYSGATNDGMPPLSTSPSTIDACELRCATTLRAERRQREAHRVVALGRAVREEPGAAAP